MAREAVDHDVRSRPGGRHRGHPDAGRPGGRKGTTGGPASHGDARPRRRARRLRRPRQRGGRRDPRTRSTRAVVGLPGAVDYESGRLLWAPNLPERWPDLLSRDVLTAGLGLPVSIANDADMAAVGEAWFGAGVGVADMGYLTVSTGIGAGIVERGRLLHGVRSLGELGHTVIDWQAWADGSAGHPRGVGLGQRPGPAGPGTGPGRSRRPRVEDAAAERERGGGGHLAGGDRRRGGRRRQPGDELLPEHRRDRWRHRAPTDLLRRGQFAGPASLRPLPRRPDRRPRFVG